MKQEEEANRSELGGDHQRSSGIHTQVAVYLGLESPNHQPPTGRVTSAGSMYLQPGSDFAQAESSRKGNDLQQSSQPDATDPKVPPSLIMSRSDDEPSATCSSKRKSTGYEAARDGPSCTEGPSFGPQLQSNVGEDDPAARPSSSVTGTNSKSSSSTKRPRVQEDKFDQEAVPAHLEACARDYSYPNGYISNLFDNIRSGTPV